MNLQVSHTDCVTKYGLLLHGVIVRSAAEVPLRALLSLFSIAAPSAYLFSVCSLEHIYIGGIWWPAMKSGVVVWACGSPGCHQVRNTQASVIYPSRRQQTQSDLTYLKLRGTRSQETSTDIFQDERPSEDGDDGGDNGGGGDNCLVSNRQYCKPIRWMNGLGNHTGRISL